MLHLSPESGLWVSCPVGDDGKCELSYHAPVEEGEVSYFLLMETYASEELYLTPSHGNSKFLGRKTWVNSRGNLHRLYNLPAVVVDGDRKEWWVDGERHRFNGPAVEHADGTTEWYQNGQLHRADGPAVEHADDTKEWWVDGQLHREDGPAVEWGDGRKEWWIDGIRINKKEI